MKDPVPWSSHLSVYCGIKDAVKFSDIEKYGRNIVQKIVIYYFTYNRIGKYCPIKSFAILFLNYSQPSNHQNQSVARLCRLFMNIPLLAFKIYRTLLGEMHRAHGVTGRFNEISKHLGNEDNLPYSTFS